MRDAQQRSNEILRDANGVIYGVVLAADYCAEHEWGIEGIQQTLGLTKNPQSFSDFCIRQSLASRARGALMGQVVNQTATQREEIIQETDHSTRDRSKKIKTVTRVLFIGQEHPAIDKLGLRFLDTSDTDQVHIAGAFSGRSFMLRGYDYDGQLLVDLIKGGFDEYDLAVWMGDSPNPFSRGGLVIARASLVPQELKDRVDAAFEEQRRLLKASEATGITKRIPRNRYYALRAAWNTSKNGKDRPSAYPVIYYLNPVEQLSNNYGWFTVEELDEWMEGRGPIPKSQ